MTNELARLKEVIASRYRRHCGSCSGSCCNLELEEEFLAFGWEFDGLDKTAIPEGGCGGGGIMHVPFNKDGRCPFSGSSACRLSMDKRPLDCLTYPVYPKVKFHENGEKELTGLTVRAGCKSLDGITGDETLLEMIRRFWEMELNRIESKDLREWLSHFPGL